MIIEHTYSQQDLRKRCYGCKWLKLHDNNQFYGTCACPHNKIKERERSVTDRRCAWKNADKYDGVVEK